MSETRVFSEDPFSPAPSDEAAELHALARALQLTKSFSVLFAVCNRAEERDRLIKALEAQLPGFTIQKLPLQSPVRHLRDVLLEQLSSPRPDAVFVYGLEAWLPAGTEAESSPFVLNLNAARNHFPQTLPCPLVFWLPQHLLTSIVHGAPDFFSVRSGVYVFAMPPEAREGLMNSLTKVSFTESTGLPYDEQQKRIASLTAMLSEYEALPQSQRDALTEARLLNSIGQSLIILGRYAEAEPFFKRSLSLRQHSLPEGHPFIATSLNNLAGLYVSQGRYQEAEPLFKQAIEIYKQYPPNKHWGIAQSLNNLALLYNNQARYKEAESLYKQAIGIDRQTLGETHPDYATDLNNLALLYDNERRYSEAESLYKQALAIRQKALMEGHPDIAQSLNNLAALYVAQGRYDEAEALLKRALTLRHQGQWMGHPDITAGLSNLAGLYVIQGRYQEAEPLYSQALTNLEMVLGKDHPNTLSTLQNYHHLLVQQGRQEEAEALLREHGSEANTEEAK